MDNQRVMSMTLGQVVEAFVDESLCDKVGTLLNDSKVSVGTVHHSLGCMLAQDICHNSDDIGEAMVALAILYHFMYQLVSQNMAKERARGLS